MSISITNHPGTPYVNTKASQAQAEGKKNPAVPGNPRDAVTISPEAREAMAKQETGSTDAAGSVTEEQPVEETVTAFPSFAVEFDKVTQQYTDAVRAYYTEAHKENLTYDDPSLHIWNKYKNPDSPDFRADLSESERGWAYDHELDLLKGGRRFQLGNPFVFGNPPTLSSAALEANQACREQMDETIQYIFEKEGIEVPKDVSFRLTVDSNYTIHVTGLEDKELAASMEQALNIGKNGENLYNHLKTTAPDSTNLGVNYVNGHLEALDISQELGEDALAEVTKQTGPICSHYSEAYNPLQEPFLCTRTTILGREGKPEVTPEEWVRMESDARLAGPAFVAQLRAGEFYTPTLKVTTELKDTYSGVEDINQHEMDTQKTIEDYYAAAHRENSSYPFDEAIQHIKDKYKNMESSIFRFDLPPAQRDMYYRQEMALLTGSPLTMRDPYALASAGGVLTPEDLRDLAMKAVLDRLDALQKMRVKNSR